MSCRWNAIRKERKTWHYPTENASIWASTKTLQYIAGHGNFSFTMNRYVHGCKKAAQEAGVKFEMLIKKTSDSPAAADVNIPSFTVSGKDKTAGVIS